MHIVGSWAKSLINNKSLFGIKMCPCVWMFCLKCCFTAHNILLVIINILSMIITYALFSLVKIGSVQATQTNSHV